MDGGAAASCCSGSAQTCIRKLKCPHGDVERERIVASRLTGHSCALWCEKDRPPICAPVQGRPPPALSLWCGNAPIVALV
eukprot:360578-Chlamydomonas_euryale.AAC.25